MIIVLYPATRVRDTIDEARLVTDSRVTSTVGALVPADMAGNLIEVAAVYGARVKGVLCVLNTRPS